MALSANDLLADELCQIIEQRMDPLELVETLNITTSELLYFMWDSLEERIYDNPEIEDLVREFGVVSGWEDGND